MSEVKSGLGGWERSLFSDKVFPNPCSRILQVAICKKKRKRKRKRKMDTKEDDESPKSVENRSNPSGWISL